MRVRLIGLHKNQFLQLTFPYLLWEHAPDTIAWFRVPNAMEVPDTLSILLTVQCVCKGMDGHQYPPLEWWKKPIPQCLRNEKNNNKRGPRYRLINDYLLCPFLLLLLSLFFFASSFLFNHWTLKAKSRKLITRAFNVNQMWLKQCFRSFKSLSANLNNSSIRELREEHGNNKQKKTEKKKK